MNRFDEAIELVDRLIRLDQLSETAHRAAIRLEYRRGRPQAALARYDVCRTALHRELELEPLEETRALAQEIEQHLTATRTSRPSGRGTGRVKTLPELSLPQPATTFVGRESELAAIEALLKESGCRFVTLVGAGGAGKTRLALQAASRLSRSYADGAHFVALASLSTPTAIASAFAEGLGFRFAEQGGPQAQLIDHLRDKELLVVVDNLEQLVEGAGWLVELVEACTTVTLLVTSREALGVAIEERHVVTGMDYPTLPDDEALERYDAVQLFVQAARRADSRFALTAETEQGVRRIVQLTEGLPLALELAAAWLARLTVGELAAEIESSYQLLSTSSPQTAERHRSMAAVFEHSWALLTDFERDSLASLTVFRGGFTREAAEAVTGTSLRTLLMLENKSLLRRDDRGRFDMLEVVRQLALAKLEEYEPVRSRHSAFFAHFLRVREAALIGEGLVRALEDVAAEIDNVRQAWDWALMQAHADGLDDMAETLCRFFENRGLMHEGEHAFKGAVEAMTGRESASPRLLVKLRSRYGFFCHRLNRFEEAESLLRQSLRELEHTQDPHEQVFALNVLGSILFARDRFPESQRAHQKGLELAQCHNDDAGIVTALAGLGAAAYARADYVEARDYFKQVLESARARKDVYSIARGGLKNVGMILGVLGEYVQAEQILKEAVALCRQLGDQRALASSLNNLGRLKLITGELDQSVAFLKECADIHAQIGNRVGVALAHSNIGEAYHEAGDLDGARSHLAESLVQFRQIENRSGMALTLSRMGFVLLDQGAPERAQQHFVEALGQAADARERAQVLNGVTGLALVLSEQGQVASAVELLTVVERLPGHERHATDQISAWLADFRSRLSAEDFTTARVKGKSRQLDTVVRELLEQQQPKE